VAYVDTPEFLNRVESDNLLKQIIPVVTLNRDISGFKLEVRWRKLAFPLGGFVNQRVHLCINGCLTLKLSLSWKTVICSSPVLLSPLGFFSSCPFEPSGEIGIVERSTGEEGLASPLVGAEATAAAMIAIV
jgi:hypothetical protein